MELSGIQWVSRYPSSTSTDDLASPFRENVQAFNHALISAGASISITTTYRPAERAYLMWQSFRIAIGIDSPADAEVVPGIGINWVHDTLAKSVAAARAMVAAYHIVFAPARHSKHSTRMAIDMNVSWSGTLKVNDADGSSRNITAPRDNNNTVLHSVAATYGVIKLVSDKPHWSADGH